MKIDQKPFTITSATRTTTCRLKSRQKGTHNKFRNFTGRASGLSVSFGAHLMGDKIDYDENAVTLMIRNRPTQ